MDNDIIKTKQKLICIFGTLAIMSIAYPNPVFSTIGITGLLYEIFTLL